jgi:hypothetical protein
MAMDKEGIMIPLLLCFCSACTRPRCMSMPQDCTVLHCTVLYVHTATNNIQQSAVTNTADTQQPSGL